MLNQNPRHNLNLDRDTRYFVTLILLQACISGALGRSAAEIELNQSHPSDFLNIAKMQELLANKEFSKLRTIAIVVELFGRIYR